MKYSVLVFSLLILFTGCVKVYNQNPNEGGRLAISSSAELMVVPDEMSILFGIEKYDSNVKNARTQTRIILDSLVKKLKEEGISEKNIEYGQISIIPRYPENQYGKRIIGYTTSLDVTVKLQNFDLISAVVDKAVSVGVNTIGNFNFYSRDFKIIYLIIKFFNNQRNFRRITR
ncbi:MAG TPA: SIMPL domain-containing protein [Spirochaetota bacterium]|nr:SIMPL domain-containing protein [Spirochaetota bacterium]